MQQVMEFASRADTMASLIAGGVIALIAVGKIGWHYWKKHKLNKTVAAPVASSSNDESLELISETYIAIIKSLRLEVDRLKKDVEELSDLRGQNDRCQEEIALLKEQNAALHDANTKQEKKIRALTAKVNRLLGKSK